MANLFNKFSRFLTDKGLKFRVSKLKDRFISEAELQAEAAAAAYASKAAAFPLRPSSALKCGRALYYDLIQFFDPSSMTVEPLNFRQRRVFQYGHIVEDFEISQINQTKGFQVTHQQKRLLVGDVHGFAVNGSIDGIVWDLKRRLPLLCDMKSTNRYSFDEIVRNKRPKLEHYAQVNLYMCSPGYKALMEELGIPLEDIKGVIIYSNKDDQQIEWIEIDPSQEVYESTLARFNRIYEDYKKQTPTPRDFATQTYPCSYCPHQQVCQGQPDPDLLLHVPFELNLEAEESDIILTLWQRLGESSTYYYDKKILAIEKLKTKWKLKVTNADAETIKKFEPDVTIQTTNPLPDNQSSKGDRKFARRKSTKTKSKAGASSKAAV